MFYAKIECSGAYNLKINILSMSMAHFLFVRL